MVWVETLTNPTLRLHDLADVAAMARARGITTVADNPKNGSYPDACSAAGVVKAGKAGAIMLLM
jgi:O-acetylhomoserine/O-acetylserine sulfhydrylase-like pyridoxal-dependent enzyme